eukprot:11167881-Lingulodinium_polyedra.AAC.1
MQRGHLLARWMLPTDGDVAGLRRRRWRARRLGKRMFQGHFAACYLTQAAFVAANQVTQQNTQEP